MTDCVVSSNFEGCPIPINNIPEKFVMSTRIKKILFDNFQELKNCFLDHNIPQKAPIHLVTTMLSTSVVVVDMPDFLVVNTC